MAVKKKSVRKKRGRRRKLLKPPSYYLRTKPWEAYLRKQCRKIRRKHGISKQVLAETKKIFSKVKDKTKGRFRSNDNIFFGSLYSAFRVLRVPVVPDDIAKISGINVRKILGIHISIKRVIHLVVPHQRPEELIESYSGKLSISAETKQLSQILCEEAREREFTLGRTPSAIAAAATYLSCRKTGEEKTQVEIAKLFGVTTTTIRNIMKKLELVVLPKHVSVWD